MFQLRRDVANNKRSSAGCARQRGLEMEHVHDPRQLSAGVTGARTCAASLGRRRLSPRRFVALALAWIFLVPALMLHASPTPASALTVPGRS